MAGLHVARDIWWRRSRSLQWRTRDQRLLPARLGARSTARQLPDALPGGISHSARPCEFPLSDLPSLHAHHPTTVPTPPEQTVEKPYANLRPCGGSRSRVVLEHLWACEHWQRFFGFYFCPPLSPSPAPDPPAGSNVWNATDMTRWKRTIAAWWRWRQARLAFAWTHVSRCCVDSDKLCKEGLRLIAGRPPAKLLEFIRATGSHWPVMGRFGEF